MSVILSSWYEKSSFEDNSMKEKHKNGCYIQIITFTNLEKYVYSKKCLKQRRQPPHPSLRDLAKSKVLSRRKNHLLFGIEYAYPADRITKRSVYRSP